MLVLADFADILGLVVCQKTLACNLSNPAATINRKNKPKPEATAMKYHPSMDVLAELRALLMGSIVKNGRPDSLRYWTLTRDFWFSIYDSPMSPECREFTQSIKQFFQVVEVVNKEAIDADSNQNVIYAMLNESENYLLQLENALEKHEPKLVEELRRERYGHEPPEPSDRKEDDDDLPF